MHEALAATEYRLSSKRTRQVFDTAAGTAWTRRTGRRTGPAAPAPPRTPPRSRPEAGDFPDRALARTR
jgi:hypothetical protein